MRTGLLFFVLVFGLSACQSAGPRPTSPTEALRQASQLLEQKQGDAAIRVLDSLPEESYVQQAEAQRKLLMAQSYQSQGLRWEAYKAIRHFRRDHPFSDFVETAASLHYQLAEWLIKSDGGFWIFWSNRRRGKSAFSDFLVAFPRNHRVPEVLRQLGETAFSEEDYELALERYTRLITDHKDSPWKTVASFRIAMCHFLRLQGPDYDLGEMRRAYNELRDFLAKKVEHPKMVEQAKKAKVLVEQWLSEKHLRIARFYKRVGNRVGYRHHLELAATEFPHTKPAKNAQSLLVREKKRRPKLSPKTTTRGSGS